MRFSAILVKVFITFILHLFIVLFSSFFSVMNLRFGGYTNLQLYYCTLLLDGDACTSLPCGDVCTVDASSPDGFICSCSDASQYLDENNDCQGNMSS